MRVSAIMPIYNPLLHLELVLESLCNQTVLVDELVVSDDGSDEDVAALIESKRALFRFPVIYARQSRRGARRARCRNNGIRVSTGDLLFFLDQDILFTSGYVETFKTECRDTGFLVGYPIRLTERQSAGITVDDIRSGMHRSVPDRRQRKHLRSRCRNDRWAQRLCPFMSLLGHRPKLRSGVFGLHRRHMEAVNGFDETYEGWGNEDDDLGRRLYRIGVRGRNVFSMEFPLHLYHPPSEPRGIRVNRGYYQRRKQEIARGDVVAPLGLGDHAEEDEPKIIRIK